MLSGLKSIRPTEKDSGSKSGLESVLQRPFTTLDGYYEFWGKLESSSTATGFFVMLAQKLVAAEKATKSGTADVAVGVSHASVLATLLQLVLYYDVQPEDKDLKALLKKRGPSKPPGAMDELTIEALLEMLGQTGSKAHVNGIVDLCTNMDASSAQDSAGSIAYGLLSGYIQRCVRQNQHVAAIIKAASGLLRLGQPMLSVPRALALLHMLRQLLLNFPRLTPEELEDVRKAVRPLLFWAQPVGGCAFSIARQVENELRLRTADLWLQLAKDVGWVAQGQNPACPVSLDSLSDAFTVHLVLNESSDWGRAFRELFLTRDEGMYMEGDRPAMHEAICAALASMLFALLHNVRPPLGIAPSKFAALSRDAVLELTSVAMQLVLKVDAGAEVAVDLQELAEGVAAFSAAGGGPGCSSTSDVQQPRLPTMSLCELRPTAVEGVSDAQVRELREAAEVSGHRRYMFNHHLAALHSRLVAYAALVERGLPPHPLRVCAAGGDGTMHRLLQAYVVLRCAYPQLCARADLRFYLVPIGRTNRLAQYIARHDGWYRRHIYTAHCRGHPTVPHLIVPANSASVRASTTRRVEPLQPSKAPQLPLHQCLVDYFREAEQVMLVKVFEVQCWVAPPEQTEGAKEAPFVTLAFCTTVEVQLAGGVGEASGGAALSVQLTMADPYGVSYSSQVSLTGRFNALSFHNLSTEPEHSPCSGRLQFRCGYASGSAKQTGEGPLRFVKTATVTAGSTTASDNARATRQKSVPPSAVERFSLLVDGDFYGPFAHIQITPCILPGGREELMLPVRTFFPIK